MRTRTLGYVLVMLLFLLWQGALSGSLAAGANGDVERLVALKGAGSNKASGFAKLLYKPGSTPFQSFQVVVAGLKADTDYQLFANGRALATKRSDATGSIEFLFSSHTKASSIEGALDLPPGFSSVLAIENISIREKDLRVAVISDFTATDTAPSGDNQADQVLSMMNNMTMEANKTATIVIPIKDPDGDPVTLSVSCDIGNFISVSNMSLVMAPRVADIGGHICSAKVTDIFGLSTQIPFFVNVIPPNQPPTLQPIADQILKSGEVKDITIQAFDPDGNAGLRLVVAQGPAYLNLIDHGDGTASLRIAPQLSDSQGGIVTIKAIDAGGLIAETSFTITLERSVMITSVTRANKNLFISGVGFGQSGATVKINNQDVSTRIVGQSDTSITLRGGAKKLNLLKGANQISVTVGGVTSNLFVLNMLAEEQ